MSAFSEGDLTRLDTDTQGVDNARLESEKDKEERHELVVQRCARDFSKTISLMQQRERMA